MKKINIILAIAAAALLVSCEKEFDFGGNVGTPIRFGAATEYDNGPATRTEYSGEKFTVGSNKYERINWVANTDRISILCNEAAGDESILDYKITSSTAASQKSTADITPVGEQFNWGTGAHYFFAMYPAPSQTGLHAGDAVLNDNGNHTVTISGKIPATQTVTLSGREYKANMNYAYMYAATKVDSPKSDVELGFKPLVTAFEITLITDSTWPIDANLTKVELSSASTNLAGNFVATIGENGLTRNPDTSNGTQTLTLDLGTGIQLSKTDPVKFTFLALPIPQKDLTLTLSFNDLKRTLELKENGAFVTVDARKKLYITNVGVPAVVDYEFEVDGPTLSISGDEQDVPYTVTSYAHSGSTQKNVTWTAKYYNENGTEISRPSWLSQFIDQGPGSTEPSPYKGHVIENLATRTKNWDAPKSFIGNEAEGNAIDLALRDIYGTSHAVSTANCYVISRPGWYKFPCVYGNAIDKGGYNKAAYEVDGIVNHYGNRIEDPWIQNNEKTSSSAWYRTYHSEYLVKLAWQDVENMITNVKVKRETTSYGDQGYMIYFYVDQNKINQGNAVICLRLHHWETNLVNNIIDDTNVTDVVWSWHIWAMEGTDTNDHLGTTAVYGHATENQSITNPNQMMNVNLGWYDAAKVSEPRSVRIVFTQNESGKTKEFTIYQRSSTGFGGNVYYQWGRKDPMLGFTENFTERRSYGDWGFQTSEEHQGIKYSILHPNFFFHKSSYDWASGMTDKLWNANGELGQDKVVKKTIYDPCPVGFKVPNKNAFTGFSISEGTTTIGKKPNVVGFWHDGYKFKRSANDTEGIFFPRTSLREWNDGGTFRPYESGHVWTAARDYYAGDASGNSGLSGVYLEYYQKANNNIGIATIHRYGPTAFGFSVRPVKE